MKLRKLLNFGESLGHSMTPVGQRCQQAWPSTVAYISRLVIHRYAMLGVLDEARLQGFRHPHADPQARLGVPHCLWRCRSMRVR
jgi:hypothetical protein